MTKFESGEEDEIFSEEETINTISKKHKKGGKSRNEQQVKNDDDDDWEERGAFANRKGGIKRKYPISSEDEMEDEDPMPSEKMWWKLVKAKFIYSFKMCQKCNNHLFCDPTKFKMMKNGDLQLTMMFCPKCVRLNIAATDVLEQAGKEQFKRKAGNEKGRKKNGW